ncbi:MAG: MFS transporter [Candidatus Hermodarchaeia archaeon]|jgi:MFS family permease
MSTEKSKFSWITIFLIGLGFFTTAISWSLFNSYIPIFLQASILSTIPAFPFVVALAGFFMGIDNLVAIIMNPLMGSRSDKTWNRFGRRMPFLIIGIPLAAGFFIGLPIAASVPGMLGLASLVILILGFDISMAIYRAPTVAMMPDFTPSKKRSPANGVINLMGGIGSIFAFVVGSILYRINPFLAFGVTALIMILALVVLVLVIREPEIPEEVEKVDQPLRQAFREAISDRSILSILIAIFAWFVAFNTLETWFTSYGVFTLLWPEYIASLAMTLFALVFVIFAIPGGLLAVKFGRRRTIMVGLVGMIITLAIVSFMRDFITVLISLGLAGFFWAFVNVNSIVMLWEVSRKKQGAYTGIYYVSSQFAAAIGPIVFGLLADILVLFFGFTLSTKWILLWPFSIVFLILALIAMIFVKRGEVGEEEKLTT